MCQPLTIRCHWSIHQDSSICSEFYRQKRRGISENMANMLPGIAASMVFTVCH